MQLTGSVNYFMNSGIAELYYFTCFNIDQMIVLAALVCSFELGNILSKLMFNNEITIQEQFNSIIKSGSAHPVIFILHKNIERLYIEMSQSRIYLIKNCISLRCFPMPFLFEIFSEDLLYS